MNTIEQVLHDTFAKYVRESLAQHGVHERDVTLRVKFKQYMNEPNEVSELFTSMYYFLVSINGAVDVSTVLAVAKACDVYCTDDDAVEHLGDHEYTLGDGDDGGACQFEGGQFRIWLRGRKVQ